VRRLHPSVQCKLLVANLATRNTFPAHPWPNKPFGYFGLGRTGTGCPHAQVFSVGDSLLAVHLEQRDSGSPSSSTDERGSRCCGPLKAGLSAGGGKVLGRTSLVIHWRERTETSRPCWGGE